MAADSSKVIQKKKKILLLERGGWGGIWHYTCCLGNALVEQGADVYAVTAEDFETPFPLLFHTIAPLKKTPAYFHNLHGVYRAIRNIRPDLLHIQSWLTARRDWLPLILLRAKGLPVIFTAHNLLPHDDRERHAPFMSWCYKRLYRSGSALIAHSQANKELLQNYYQIAAEKIAVIPHGNYRFFAEKHQTDRAAARARLLKEHAGKRIFLIFGALRHYKGIDLALQAMASLPGLDRMHLVVAGKPFDRVLEECQALAEKLGIRKHVTFCPGYFTDAEVAAFHAAADILVFPYRDIFQSGALQVALGFGKPLIATKVGSFPETLTLKNSWLAEPESPADIRVAFEKALAADAQTLKVMGEESLRISLEEHSWQRIALKTSELYNRVS